MGAVGLGLQLARIENEDEAVKTKKWISLLLSVGVLASCQSSDQLPAGASLQINPTSRSYTITVPEDFEVSCYTGPGMLYEDVPLLISLANDSGVPLGGVEVNVYSDYAGNTFSGADVLQLFEDLNGNGVIDGDSELVSGIEDGVYETKTSRSNGTAFLMLRMNLTCPYKGTIFAFAGQYSASMDANVLYETEQSTDTEGEVDE